ncbi:MAG: DUF692 family protein [Nitrospiraceae bacterium]
MSTVLAQFFRRVEGISFHGFGLSADAYQPDLFDVLDEMGTLGCAPGYVELFRASTPMLAAIRDRLPTMLLPYHAEGLWLTHEGWGERERTHESADLSGAVEQIETLRSAWLNHECASKVVGGHALGTYLPPYWSRERAEHLAANSVFLQARLDAAAVPRVDGQGRNDAGALVLLELPPLTYFSLGTLAVPEFFRLLCERSACGLVLDMGHLWTHWRYGSGRAAESIESFVTRFLADFPVERIVEIHVAGLTQHPTDGDDAAHDVRSDPSRAPRWLDTHGAPIPAVLFDMLEQVLGDPRLRSLKGLALEVDTKEPTTIAEEFAACRARFGRRLDEIAVRPSAGVEIVTQRQLHAVQSTASLDDEAYAALVLPGDSTGEDAAHAYATREGLARYREQYLPYEILHWGGDLVEMFPETCERLVARGIDLNQFVTYWFAAPSLISAPYDFFLLKLARFLAFVESVAPDCLDGARREAESLEAAYALVNAPPVAAGARP